MQTNNIEYTVIRGNRRSVALVVDTDANLIVRAPYRMTDRAIAEFVASKQNWIEKHLEKMRQTSPGGRSSGMVHDSKSKELC